MFFILSLYIFFFYFFLMILSPPLSSFFFFNDTATTEIYTLSLHDALPISIAPASRGHGGAGQCAGTPGQDRSADRRQHGGGGLLRLRSACGQHARALCHRRPDRKSTRLNSSHLVISYAVFCLKKKNSEVDRLRNMVLKNAVLVSSSGRVYFQIHYSQYRYIFANQRTHSAINI